MRELLKRWAELEPELCKYLKDGVALPINGEWVFIYTTPFDGNMFIQWKVQQAIEARGWVFHLTPVHWRVGNFYEVIIVTPGRDGSSESENITEALLSAYLKALDGVTRKG